MANSIVRERETGGGQENREVQGGARGQVISEVMGHIQPWREYRDGTFEEQWDEYYAKWRGFWMPEHRAFKTERSKLISPLTSMAIDLTASEIIEGVFGREYFVDLPDDYLDAQPEDMATARKMLVEDLKQEGIVTEFAKTAVNGCLFGNGIMKIQINTKKKRFLNRLPNGDLVPADQEIVQIKPVCIDPGNFVGDPGVVDIDDMHGCAHEFMMPLHLVEQRQQDGVYYDDVKLGAYNLRKLQHRRGDTPENSERIEEGQLAFITEYYGKISTRNYRAAIAEGQGKPLTFEQEMAIPEHLMTEVIATVGNEGHLLRVIKNPNPTGERLVMGYQHETVPGRFNGRGVAEKAANIQRAMDAEMRARIDGLAWSNNPMFAGDLTRLPPNSNLNAWPGKFWGTRGKPDDVLREFKISGPDQNTFQHMQELERMGQQATGALDSSGLRGGVRDETAAGSALAASSFVKRSKRTMFNIEDFLSRLVRRSLHLKMRFEPQRYPQDYEFQVRGSVGIMAREIESNFMVNMLSVIGPDSPASTPIIKAIFEHSGSPVKTEVLQALKALEEKQPSPEEQAAQKAQLEAPVLDNEKTKAEIAQLQGTAGLKGAQAQKTGKEAQMLDTEVSLDVVKVQNELQQTANQSRQMEILADRNRLTDRQLDIQEEQVKVDARKTNGK
jgi:hypothetical protein